MINQITDISEINQEKIINQIRSLGIDMIHEANSGHPGIVLGAAPIIYTVYAHHLRVNPQNPNYFNRDRFVMSAGHGSALLYATLYLAGYDLSLEDLKQFRQIDSKTPGHPEYGRTPGVDCTTGPLGTRYPNLIDYNTYVLCGDGDLMEGISYEAASLAGTLKLHKLIVLYDSNNICLDGKTSDTFNDNISMRFISQGWNVITVEDGNSFELINKAIEEAKTSTDKPTLIEIKTTIGKYSLLEGTNKIHGTPPTEEDITQMKEKMGVRNIPFAISQNILEEFQYIMKERCENIQSVWEEKLVNKRYFF